MLLVLEKEEDMVKEKVIEYIKNLQLIIIYKLI